jgi:hypothetical protein
MNCLHMLREIETLENELQAKYGGSARVLALYQARQELMLFYGIDESELKKNIVQDSG